MTRGTDFACCVCGRTEAHEEGAPVSGLRTSVARFLEDRHGPFVADARVCRPCLYVARTELLLERLQAERGELSAIEREVARKASEHQVVARNIEEEFARSATRADRLADGVARYGGSWTFVIGLVTCLIGWMLINSARADAFDPFPFILLNLLLSFLAAFQAPVILMSSNRQAARDRRQADQDFLVNLKAEIEIASLHEKLDHLLHVQWDQLVELQELQIEMLGDLLGRREG
ncbi:MAG TPA: DUF1003 domain-containing protein [Myxococcota bacterium]|nr:DUF1003 domain-containing protein [Myxococcota bacterium]